MASFTLIGGEKFNHGIGGGHNEMVFVGFGKTLAMLPKLADKVALFLQNVGRENGIVDNGKTLFVKLLALNQAREGRHVNTPGLLEIGLGEPNHVTRLNPIVPHEVQMAGGLVVVDFANLTDDGRESPREEEFVVGLVIQDALLIGHDENAGKGFVGNVGIALVELVECSAKFRSCHDLVFLKS
jgi:hypothetical protein